MSLIREDADRNFAMSKLYQVMGCSRQAVAQQARREQERFDCHREVLADAKRMREQYRWIGSRRLYYMAGISTMGINQFERLMSKSGLCVQRLRKRILTTESKGGKHIYPNLLYAGYTVCDVNEVVVCDLTYFQNSSGLYYISLITDVYSQRIVGATAAEDKRSIHAYEALQQLVRLRGPANMECTIHHGDKGSEYRSDQYIGELKHLKMQISMADNCLENGHAEKRNDTVKNEFLFYFEMAINNICQLRKALKIAIHRYNHEVVQAKLNYLTPAMYEALIASLPPEDRPRIQLHDFSDKQRTK